MIFVIKSSAFRKSIVNSNYDLLALIFYTYTFLLSTLYGHQPEEPYGLVIYTLFFVFIFLQELQWNYQNLSNFFTLFKLVCLSFSAFLFMMYISTDTASYLKWICIVSPCMIVIHYLHLTKNTTINKDKWIGVQSKFEKYNVNDKIVIIEPLDLAHNQTHHEEVAVSFFNSHKIRTLSRSFGAVRFKAFTDHYHTINFNEMSFLFLKSSESGVSKYVIPSHENFHQLSGGQDQLGYGMSRLKRNTLTDLFISNLLSSLKLGELEAHTNLSTYTDHRKVFKIDLSYDDSELSSVTHVWTYAELQTVASRVVSAFLDDNRTMAQLRLEWYIRNSLDIFSKNLALTNHIIANFWSMLTKLNSSMNNFNQNKVIASIRSFWTTSDIVLKELSEVGILSSTRASGGEVLQLDIADLIKKRLDDFAIYCEAPTEKFIQIHDNLHRSLIEKKGIIPSLEKIDSMFDRIIQSLILQLKKSTFKQNQNRYSSSSQQDMIHSRSGIVVGATMTLSMVYSILEDWI